MWSLLKVLRLGLLIPVVLAVQVFAQDIETRLVEAEPRCLSGGILNGYRCKSEDPSYDDGVRYSVQLLQDQRRGDVPFNSPFYHQTHLGEGRSFVYLGEYQTQAEALAAAEQLVDKFQLSLNQWRPAIVEIDKSSNVPAIRLVQMYRNDSYAHLAPKKPGSDPSTRQLTNGGWQQRDSYYTIQLGSYKKGPSRLGFIRRNQDLGLLCRTKRNGQLAVYTGTYDNQQQALERVKNLPVRGYVLKLNREDMYSCNDGNRKILVYSKTPAPSNTQQVAGVDSASVFAKVARKTPANWEPKAQEPFYTVQLAAFKTRQRERRFINRYQSMELLCRIRRNGKFAVYSGKFKHFAEAKQHMELLPYKKGYVLRLTGELLPACRG